MAPASAVAGSVRNCERLVGVELCLLVELTWGVTKWLMNPEPGDCLQWMPGDESNY
jgi:hypothetical protein